MLFEIAATPGSGCGRSSRECSALPTVRQLPTQGERELMKSRILAFVAAVFVAAAGHGWAQETTGSISGRLTDPQGLAVPGATVTLTGPQGTKTTVTDAD